ncbi:formylglycine-generating enzyme family protein [Spirulina sp. 06S082]|uniref:formylglycine-generating enzyme family protein n=1 Tax=Spirulina sp. 06S082 TaxID=3110248 RepID=UPI002B1F3C1A|nr:formylglycine-generating enzyme family protein [Spirulina sp. 06S082]MEA5472223.1 formylglycine-generating enzyme family protein [Spirulina sp. 06S082]
MIALAFPLREKHRKRLKEFQRLWELRDEDILPIEERLAPTEVISPKPQKTRKQAHHKPVSYPYLPSFSFEVVTVNAKGKKIKRERRSANYQREDLGNGVNLDMVEIPGGEFMMGTEEAEIERLCKKYGRDWFKRESPQHKVTVKPFLMGKTPIIQAQWREVVNRVETIERDLNPDPSHFKGDKRPVESVSWYDAVEFCVRLSKLTEREYRLPSEAEWEYGCRGGTKTPFHFGETITTDLANYCGQDRKINETLYKGTFANEPKGKYRKETTLIDEFAHPNAFGLYDMHGNVWEWCLDPWHDNYEGAPADGRVWDENDNDYQNLFQNLKELLRYKTNACLRGGSWYYNPDDCRSSYRLNPSRDFDSYDFGFRVVSSPVAGV